jgi:hypothetical protein
VKAKWLIGSITVLVLLLAIATPALASTTIAWQPSHQDDNGGAGWHEYMVCGDITDRTLALLPSFTNAKCWETSMGLWGTNNYGGTNRTAFDSEIAQANAAHANVFISVHINGNTPSGFTGFYFTGDAASSRYAEALMKSVAVDMSMPYLGTVPMRFYSLDPIRNKARIRVLLELGDNVRDRALLETEDGRQRIARALATAINDNTLPPIRYEQTSASFSYSGRWKTTWIKSASGGSFRFMNSPGSVTIRFTGTKVAWIAKKSPQYGKATLRLDGTSMGPVDLFSSLVVWKQKIWESGNLSDGAHTLKIEWTGQRSLLAFAGNINIDAVDVVP